MRRPAPFVFFLLNLIVAALVAIGVFWYMNNQSQPASPVQVITVEVRITATRDPNLTPEVRIITATPLPGSIGVGALPTGLIETPSTAATPVITLDATALQVVEAAIQGNAPLQATVTSLPANCLLHVIAEGDTPYGVALQYGADFFRLMEVNGLSDETASLLQIGDVLIVPLEGCTLAAPATATPEGPTETPTSAASPTTNLTVTATPSISPTPSNTPTPTPTATITLPPTAASAQVEIVEVVSGGDVTAEGVVIRNQGNSIDLNGWTLTDSEGNTYTFSQRLVFSNASVTLFTRTGTDTPVVLFQNQSQARYAPGDTLTLRDSEGRVQSTYRVPTAVSLP
ncbi:MAG: lamin tail domain-containing protein [Anaerolineae bacterium]|nr:lamin tail domain-containing protein [Anaerolineae bacterium]